MSHQRDSYHSPNTSTQNPGKNPSSSFPPQKPDTKQGPTESTSLLGPRANASGTDISDKKSWYRPW